MSTLLRQISNRNINRLLLLTLVLIFTNKIYAQSPGGYSTNINLWLKANSGTSSNTNGATLSSWLDQALSNDASQSTGTSP